MDAVADSCGSSALTPPAATSSRGAAPARRRVRRTLGRPVASDGSERRRLIIEAARRQFARAGYLGTTNREIAEQAGITTGAIYHYFRSKLDVYLAVFEETDRVILERYREATANEDLGFDELVAAILEVSSQLNLEDQSLADFIVTASFEAARRPELAASYRRHDRAMTQFFAQLADRGVAEGIIDADDRREVLDAIRVLTLGLTAFSVRVHDPKAHLAATGAVVRALRGDLFPRRRTSTAARRRRTGA